MNGRAHGRRMLLIMAGLCLLPVLAAWGVFHLSPAFERRSYGELLPTDAFAAAALPGWPLGSWSLVSVEPAACDAACTGRRFLLRQVRLAQGEAASRIVAVRLTATADSVPQTGKTLVAPLLVRQLARRGFFLIDPHGNQVLFYPDGSDPLRVIDEINRVLRINNAL